MCLPCCQPQRQQPGGGQPGTFAAVTRFVLSPFAADERSMLSEACDNLKDILPCNRTQAVVASAMSRAVARAVPDASEDCITPAMQGILRALADTLPEFNDPANLGNAVALFIDRAAEHVVSLLKCLFGEERTQQIVLESKANWRAAQALPGALIPILLTLVPIIARVLCGNAGGTVADCCVPRPVPTAPGVPPVTPPPGETPGTGPGDMPIFGADAPPHNPPVNRGGSDPIRVGQQGSM